MNNKVDGKHIGVSVGESKLSLVKYVNELAKHDI